MTICQWPDPILARPVAIHKLSLDEVRRNFLVMTQLLKTRPDGIALAANQAGIDADMFIYIDNDEMIGVLNPVVTEYSKKKYLITEGCLSLDSTEMYNVIRHDSIKVNYTHYPSFKVLKREIAGLEAEIFQHEIDHLRGLTLLDRMG